MNWGSQLGSAIRLFDAYFARRNENAEVGNCRLGRATESVCYLLFVCSVHGVELAVFRRARRADQAVAHAIELDPDECLLNESLFERVEGLMS